MMGPVQLAEGSGAEASSADVAGGVMTAAAANEAGVADSSGSMMTCWLRSAPRPQAATMSASTTTAAGAKSLNVIFQMQDADLARSQTGPASRLGTPDNGAIQSRLPARQDGTPCCP